jgi:hypothetical protein
METLLMAIAAGLILGPGLAHGSLILGVLGSSKYALLGLGSEAWILSGLAAGLGWLSILLPAYSTFRQTLIVQPSWTRRPAQRTLVQRRFIDLFLLIFGGLLTWQLRRSGSFLMTEVGESQLADPLLLIGPTLMLFAGALVVLRALPVIFRLLDQLLNLSKNLVWKLSLSRLARAPVPPARTVLLVGLTTGLILFSTTLDNTITNVLEGLQLPQHDALTQGYSNALGLNAATVTIFSLLLFVLIHLFSILERQGEHDILRRLGLSSSQMLVIIAIEGSLALALGLATGVLLGLGLSMTIIPFFLDMLIDHGGRLTAAKIVFDWRAIFQSGLILAGLYTATLILLQRALYRSQALPVGCASHRMPWPFNHFSASFATLMAPWAPVPMTSASQGLPASPERSST